METNSVFLFFMNNEKTCFCDIYPRSSVSTFVNVQLHLKYFFINLILKLYKNTLVIG